MTTSRFFGVCASLLAALCAAYAVGLPPGSQPGLGVREALSGPLLSPVRAIESADRINDWEHLDDQHIVLRVGPADEYLITLKSRCLGLNWARNVGVTMSNNTIWAGFDAITVDGNQCAIETINPVATP